MTLLGLIVVLCAIASVASPWAIGIRPARAVEGFGFQTPACWLVVLALLVAVLAADGRVGVAAVMVGAGGLLGWFAWAMWVVTTKGFADLSWPFVGTDVIGAGWYVAGGGLFVAAGDVVKGFVDRDAPARADFWLLGALPGVGLMRMGRWGRGAAWTFVFSMAVILAAADSPDMTLFQEYGRTNNLPPPPSTRAPEWILLGIAAFVWALSVGAALIERRRAAGPRLRVVAAPKRR